jgi:dihydropyrimidinase
VRNVSEATTDGRRTTGIVRGCGDTPREALMSLLLKGGRIVTATDDFVGDIYVEGETIALVGASLDREADRVIDVSGKLVMPGAIDPHTHIEMEFGGAVTRDDFTSGTVSAAFGGTTTLIDFCMQAPGRSISESLERHHEKLTRCKPVIDVGFHIAITDLRDGGSLSELDGLSEEGITSYKLFMAYKGTIMVDDETLFRSMRKAAETGALVMVHAENGDAIDILVNEARAAGKREPIWHARTRPPDTEAEATSRAIYLAHVAQAPLYVVHVSCAESLEPIALARAKGWNVSAETCTQYLFVDESALERPDFEGAKYVYTPPPRAKQNQEHLWRALADDVLSVVSTDHCPFNWPQDKGLGRDDFSKIPNGGPGIEDRLMMLHTFGVEGGRLGLQRFVELTATNPAKLFGLYPRKGTITPGADADLVVWNPSTKRTLSASRHHSNVNYNLYEGTDIVGAPEYVFVRGRCVIEGERLAVDPGWGAFVKRARHGESLELGRGRHQ